ncbi:alpha/beta hydrolase [Mediannikoviicoccus vaginalis]|uniref:alpha/beta hydrolase n=1 Tax=Mediannikoviicoccus vaginalis TaxID=2899727 RepID=UPI001F1F2F92|nr:alpha/beta fold hydrolase [Mediannikoviicoccus vaginalis]
MKKSKRKIVQIVLITIFVIIIGALWFLSASIYNDNINKRFESYKPLMYRTQDFEELNCSKYEFPSDKGQMLMGSLYSAGENQKGIIIVAHGFGGGGHNSYMDCINYFAKNGYYVFAYDATGNDESEGEGVGGFPQGVIDLDHAISFVEDSEILPNLPMGLFGHSWGGYSVSSVLSYHPEVKAVIACCGTNSSSDIFKAGGREQAGDFINVLMPFVKVHEFMKFGKYALNTAMDGFESSDAKILIAHSEDDDMVPIEYGYDLFYEKYKDDKRFTFLHFTDRGHSDFFIDGKNTYKEEFNSLFDKWEKSLDYDYKVEENKKRFMKEKAEFIEKNLDRKSWSERLDVELFEQFVDFYDEAMTLN